MKDKIKIVLLSLILITLLCIFAYLVKNKNYYFKIDSNTEEKEVVDDTKENNDIDINEEEQGQQEENKEEPKKEEPKKDTTTKKEENKKSNNSNNNSSNKTNNSTETNEQKKEEVIDPNYKGATLYKTVDCRERQNIDDFTAMVEYRGYFKYNEVDGWNPDIEIESSSIQLEISYNYMDLLDEENKKELDAYYESLKSSVKGYNLSYTREPGSGSARYYWTATGTQKFLNYFDDFGNKKVTYTNFLNYFKSSGITCTAS